MDKIKKLDDCFEEVPESITAAKWATLCRIIGWIMTVVCFIAGIVIGANAYRSGFDIFLGFSIGGFIIAAGFWILAAVLDALASLTQSNAETARMTYYRMQADVKELSAK